MIRAALIAMPLAVAMMLGCGSEEPADQRACTPGLSQACVGPGACQGGQICKSDGTGYGPCDCGAGVGGSGGTGGSTGGSAGSTSVCPTGLPGPALVEVKSPTGVAYCIDATEVTWGQWNAFLAAGFDSSSLDKCKNVSFGKSPNTAACLGQAMNTSDSAPVGCVTFCDAVGYCAWAGKRLCGKIGGGAADISKPADPADSQWFNACSAGGTLEYSTGDSNKCSADVPRAAVGSRPGCEGPTGGLFDMTGNAEEWEDSCLIPSDLNGCRLRDGNPCAGDYKTAWLLVEPSRGFRCCHDGK